MELNDELRESGILAVQSIRQAEQSRIEIAKMLETIKSQREEAARMLELHIISKKKYDKYMRDFDNLEARVYKNMASSDELMRKAIEALKLTGGF